MSPELLDPESFDLKRSRPTKESDCYALGMVIYEVLSGRAPFSPSKAPVLKVLRGNRPERPQGAQGAWFTDGIWGMLELCWKSQPAERIGTKTVLLCLEGTPSPSLPSSPNVGGDTETGAPDQSDAPIGDSQCVFSPFWSGLVFNYPCPVIGPPISQIRPERFTPQDESVDRSAAYSATRIFPNLLSEYPIAFDMLDPEAARSDEVLVSVKCPARTPCLFLPRVSYLLVMLLFLDAFL